jgi:hypothetical protein
MRAGVRELEKTSQTALRAMRWGIDWLERRDERRQGDVSLQHRGPVSAPPPVEPVNTDETIDETLTDTFPASDSPSSWAGPPNP